jgi:hypothetical protein
VTQPKAGYPSHHLVVKTLLQGIFYAYVFTLRKERWGFTPRPHQRTLGPLETHFLLLRKGVHCSQVFFCA